MDASTLLDITNLSDRELIVTTARAAERERGTTAELLGLLAELDSRRLYLGEGCSSLFTYCTQVLHLSEPAAYGRITAARAARRFPVLLALVASGAITLTTIGLLAAHLTEENHEALLDAARFKTKREVEMLVAALHPQPDIRACVRKLPEPMTMTAPRTPQSDTDLSEPAPQMTAPLASGGRAISRPQDRPIAAPLTPERYLIRVTVGRETHERLERAKALLGHTIPNGDLAGVIDRALIALLAHLERTNHAAATRPRSRSSARTTTRYVPATVKRAVWARDAARCAFVGSLGRCTETTRLEYHHVVPFATGGPTSVDNLQLRCRAHNGYEAEREFGYNSVRTELR